MGLFLLPVSPVPPSEDMSATDRLWDLRQDGRPLESMKLKRFKSEHVFLVRSTQKSTWPDQFNHSRFPPRIPPVGLPMWSCQTQSPDRLKREPQQGPNGQRRRPLSSPNLQRILPPSSPSLQLFMSPSHPSLQRM
ncbi:hypothetical protein DPX16_19818 [Anabarilius grahami]|uniref:Uncharacterized protein n=1 Tax=Anabarilius grahami TaxID=495550 RepID=A0A3N0Y710_ANAGA|nr:hypothetical protein DPX16_19818 [Anabarilius grahami]